MKLHDRYLTRELLKIFIPFLLCFYALFSMLDYTTHVQDFIKSASLSFNKIMLYYFFLLIKELHLLLPLSLLISTIKVLTALNTHHELGAFFSSGISLSRLLRPFTILALISGAIIGLNFEFIVPRAEHYIDHFQSFYLRHQGKKKQKRSAMVTLPLLDHSKIVYHQRRDRPIEDLFWIKSNDEIWHFKKVDFKENLGYYGDRLLRNKEGFFEKSSSHPLYALPEIALSKKQAEAFRPDFSHRAISSLFQDLNNPLPFFAEAHLTILTQIFYKLSAMLAPFLVLSAIIPSTVTYRRHIPHFLLYAIALFGFILYFVIMNCSVIVGESGRLAPWAAVLLGPLILQTVFLLRLSPWHAHFGKKKPSSRVT